MAIPDNRTSSLLLADHFIPPDDLDTTALLVYELGGIGLNDPSAGLRYQTWTLRYFPDTGDVVVDAPEYPATILFTRADITEIDLAFDQNMNPFVAFVEAGVAKFWWFDTNISQTVFSNLPANSKTPRCCLDDKRETQTDASDIVLCYILNGDLKARYQRDRYSVEYTIKADVRHPVTNNPAVLKKVGMNIIRRLQWLLTDPTMDEICP